MKVNPKFNSENDILLIRLKLYGFYILGSVIIIWFMINGPTKNTSIKFVNEDEENHIFDLIQLQNRVPNSDELYRAIHGNESMKNELREIRKKLKRNRFLLHLLIGLMGTIRKKIILKKNIIHLK